ncbi:MAG: ABC transporter permease [Bryobacteraceae bacterium]|nr:ABC transporter permease [Bryobacteraceae bacterium]
MTGILFDIRYAFRTLLRSPVFTTVAVLSLALGIGANTAIFTLLDQLLLRLLPVNNPEQLVMIWHTGPHMGNNRGTRMSSYPMYQDYAKKAEAFSSVFCRYQAPSSISFEGRTERVNAELVSGNYFQALGVKPGLGRLFTPEEDDRVYKGHPYVVLSHHYWVNRFNADPKVIGSKLLVNNYPMTIVGVSAPGFTGIDPSRSPDIRVPMQMKPIMSPGWDSIGDRRSQWIQMFARMKPGFTLEKSRSSLQPLFYQILTEELKEMKDVSAFQRDRFLKREVKMEPAATGYSDLRRSYQTALLVLMGMVALVLLISCFNVANLLIARAVARRKEIAVRLSVGASRARLVRQLIIESLVLSLTGGLAGLILSDITIRGLLTFLPQDGSAVMLKSTPDLRILAFDIALAIVTGLIFGLAPALQSTKLDLWTTLKDVVGAVTGTGSSVRLRKILVTAQVALSFLLLAGAGLFVKSLNNLKNTNTGFRDISSLVSFQLDPALNGYDVPRLRVLNDQLLANIRANSGVKDAGYATVALLHGWEWDSSMSVEGHEIKDGEDMQAFMNSISPGYFRTMGTPLIAGRDFDQRDAGGDEFRVALVNRKFAVHFFKEPGNAVGRHIGFGTGPKSKLDIEIVGVVEDSLYEGPREGVRRQAFVPYAQSGFPSSVSYYVRTTQPPKDMYRQLRSEVMRLDPAMPVYELKTLETQLDETLGTERLIATLSTAFGLLATLLAAIGLYGVMAFVVARRTKEIGLRMALGAPQSSVAWMVMKEVLLLLAIGCAVGIPVAYGLSQYVSSQLFGVQPTDFSTAGVAVSILAVVTAFAGLIPSLRASMIDPMTALRYE